MLAIEKSRRTEKPWGIIAALLALAAGAVFVLYYRLHTPYPHWVVEYGYSAYRLGPFERVFLFWYTGLAVVVTIGLGLGLALLLPPRTQPPQEHSRVLRRAYALVVVAFALALASKFLVLHNAPTMDDENVYHFTAQLLAHGKLTLKTGLPPELFQGRWGMVYDQDRGRIYGMYPHGWPALLALGYLLRVPWLINPLLAAAIMLLAADFARRAFGGGTAALALLLFVLSPFFILTSGTDLSQPAVAAGILAAVVAAVRYCERPHPRWLWLCGAAGGFAFLARQLTTLGLLTPFVIYLLLRLWKERRTHPFAGRAAALLVPFLVAAATYLALNWATTGDPLQPGYDVFVRAKGVEGRTLGFGVDYTPIGGAGVHTVSRGVADGYLNLIRLNTWMLGWPLSLLLVFCARPNLWTRLTLAAVGLQLALYIGFFNPGLCLTGPTYYYEANCLLLVLAADGLVRLARWYRELPAAQAAPRAAGALLATIAFVNLVMFSPTYVRSLYYMTEGTSMLSRTVGEAGLRQAVVFVKNVQPQWKRSDLYKSFVFHARTNASFDDEVIFLNDLGPEKNREALRKHFPARSGFRYGVEGDWKPQLTPLE